MAQHVRKAEGRKQIERTGEEKESTGRKYLIKTAIMSTFEKLNKDISARIKIEITFIFRLHHRYIQLIMLVTLGLSLRL